MPYVGFGGPMTINLFILAGKLLFLLIIFNISVLDWWISTELHGYVRQQIFIYYYLKV